MRTIYTLVLAGLLGCGVAGAQYINANSSPEEIREAARKYHSLQEEVQKMANEAVAKTRDYVLKSPDFSAAQKAELLQKMDAQDRQIAKDREAKQMEQNKLDALERIARLQSEQLEQQKEAAKQADYRARQQIEATKNIAGYEKGCPYWIVNGERVYGLNYRFSSKKD